MGDHDKESVINAMCRRPGVNAREVRRVLEGVPAVLPGDEDNDNPLARLAARNRDEESSRWIAKERLEAKPQWGRATTLAILDGARLIREPRRVSARRRSR